MSTASTEAAEPRDARDTGEARSADRSVSGAEIVFDDVTKTYPGQTAPAVDSLSLTIPAGQVVMFVGPSGCGKTTSLKMINRLHEPTSGTITIDGEDIRSKDETELRRHIGYVIQGGSLFPHMSVRDNIALVPRLLGWDKKRVASRVDELLDLVGLSPERYRDRYPRELSGGQQQRVGVARGLAADPPVLLMDEPFGAVDPITRQRLQDELMSIQEELQKTIVCVTHDIDEAIKLGDRILILQEGANIAQYDTPANILAAPANSFVEDFVGSDSSLKQLALMRVSELDLHDAVTARVGDDGAEAARAARSARQGGVIVLDDKRRPAAWVGLREAERVGTLRASSRDLEVVDHRATLNDALDSMLAASHGGVLVTGRRDEFLGVLEFDTVTEHIQTLTREARTGESDEYAITPSEDELQDSSVEDDTGSGSKHGSEDDADPSRGEQA
ncbi:betaine/proline/choline family ABC transporter ATP-binding protein [Marihabitans asiaticum]|uniref:ABC-type quaternary amine transporter n=1 Tax=Marihabitans asiaticum TaxID=415218 RepID=A0A560WDG7_9MICO|nr:ATP-binding cassette domain-containing protein [Marihabitans asiaticum]TWD15697.1 osmoprotectant transport system ATP-binding protein [Marihabitans asiaticum]